MPCGSPGCARLASDSVWLNPQPEEWWDGHQSIQIVRRLLEDRMFPLTLAGLDGAIMALR